MNNHDHDPEIYVVITYMLLFIGVYILYNVFTINNSYDNNDSENEHSN